MKWCFALILHWLPISVPTFSEKQSISIKQLFH